LTTASAPGRFITLEGGEGVGKSTQATRLAQALRARGHDVIVTREPGGTAGAEAIRALVMTGNADRWGARAEALLFAAARADHVEKVIRPALAAGTWVICDRFVDSSRAYQGGAGGLSDADIMDLHRIGSSRLMPDRTILMCLAEEEAENRAESRAEGNADRFGARDRDFHAGLKARFDRFAANEAHRFRVVDASGAPDDVTARILEAIA